MTVPAPLLAHYQTLATTVADAIFIVRPDGQRYGFTTHDVSAEIDVTPFVGTSGADMQEFDAGLGLDATSIVMATGSAVANLEIAALDDGTIFTTDDIMQKRWRNSEFWIFRYNYNVLADIDVQLTGTIGEIRQIQNQVVIELRGLNQKLRQSIGPSTSKTCRARLGDDACGVDLTPFTFNTTVTSVASKSEFTCSGLAQAADYFTEGEATFTSGDNAGVTEKVRMHETGGVISLSLPMWKTIQIGDTLTIIAGCLKTRDVCRVKFANARRMQAEPDTPSIDRLTTSPVPPA